MMGVLLLFLYYNKRHKHKYKLSPEEKKVIRTLHIIDIIDRILRIIFEIAVA